MNIVVIGQMKYRYDKHVLVGGLESFEHMLVTMLSYDKNNKYTFITHRLSEDADIPTIQLQSSSELGAKTRYTKAVKEEILGIINSINPDAVVFVSKVNIGIVNKLKHKTKVFAFQHAGAGVHGMVQVLECKQMKKYENNINHCIVSHLMLRDWEKYSTRVIGSPVKHDFVFYPFVIFDDKPELVAIPKNDFCMIARLSPQKNILGVANVFENSNQILHVYHPKVKDGDSVGESILHKLQNNKNVVLHQSIPHDTIMKELRSYKACFISALESFGIVACESVLMGTKVALYYNKGDHTIEEFLPDNSYVRLSDSSSVLEYINTETGEYDNYSDTVYNTFYVESQLNNFISILDNGKCNYVESNSIDMFM